MHIILRPSLPPQLTTHHLLLREVRCDDISEKLLWWLNDPDTTQYLEIRHMPQTTERVQEYIKKRIANPEEPHFGVFGVKDRQMIGTVTINLLNRFYKSADISFVIGHPDARGKGYGTEAVHAVCAYMFHVAGLHKLTGGLYRDNLGSRRIFEKNGFTLEGVRRAQCLTREGLWTDVLLFGLLAEDFTPNFTLLGGTSINVREAGE